MRRVSGVTDTAAQKEALQRETLKEQPGGLLWRGLLVAP